MRPGFHVTAHPQWKPAKPPVRRPRATHVALQPKAPRRDDDMGQPARLGSIRGLLPTAPAPLLAPLGASRLLREIRRRALLSA